MSQKSHLVGKRGFTVKKKVNPQSLSLKLSPSKALGRLPPMCLYDLMYSPFLLPSVTFFLGLSDIAVARTFRGVGYD
jgi:hypothetical protein